MVYTLTASQTAYIISWLKQRGINDKQVLQELTDHLALITEANLNDGYAFDTAFRNAAAKFQHKELLHVAAMRESFYAYPKFLNKTFLIVFGVLSLAVFATGVYLRYHHLPLRRVAQFVGAISFGYFFLPLLLLYCLTEYANKTKYVFGFMCLFAAFHSAMGWYMHWGIAKTITTFTIITTLLWLITYLFIPFYTSLKRNKTQLKINS
ncbi:MAG: hypothetical protein H7Y07_18090 [Pyrinomonadaceae bacterium]|nr:hypothetical protein [Sphingobacteriaceae bacterium]